MSGAVARRYARALFSLGAEDGAGDFEVIGGELDRLVATLRDEGIARVAANPTLDAKTRRDVARRLSVELRLSPTVANFLALVADRNRLPILPAIHREYRRFADRRLGRLRATIASASPLNAESIRRVSELFERRTGKKVIAETRVDAELLGGVVVEIEGRVYDGSLRSQLGRLRAALAG